MEMKMHTWYYLIIVIILFAKIGLQCTKCVDPDQGSKMSPKNQILFTKAQGSWSYHLGARIQGPAQAQLLQIEK